VLQTISLLIISYFIGAVPFSWIIAKLTKGIDLRYEGEGNVGARNVWHTVGYSYGALASVLDLSKGIAVFFIAKSFAPSQPIFWLSALAVVLGHDFPIFLKGRGGKGASVLIGFLFGCYPLASLLSFGIIPILFVLRVGFHISVSVGITTLVLFWLPVIFKRPFGEVLAVILLLLFLGFKRIIDAPHMRKIRAKSGWRWE